MAEYIEMKKLEEAFDNADPDVCESYLDGHSDWGFGRENVRDVIRGVPTADVAPEGWISVKDKLPEPEQDVLVIAHGWSDRLLYIGSYQRMEAETSWLTGVTSKASDWSLWGWSYLREPEVTHWMPLPEPPKED